MSVNQFNAGVVVAGDLTAHDISVVIQPQPQDPPPKNIRFKVEKPIQTFTGREAFLEDLHKVVKGGHGQDQEQGEGGKITVLTQAPLSVVAATGGIGKTETVRMYMSLHEHEYDHIIWIDAEKTSSSRIQFAQLARELKISTDFDGKPKEFDSLLKEIFETLLQHAHVVLLVLDNAEAFEEDAELNLNGIRSLLPKSLSPFFIQPTIIATSRNQNWTLQNVIQLDLWTEAEVLLFVIRQLKLERNSENEKLALQLGTVFGRLPIALQSAVAVILQQTKRRNKNYGIQTLIDEYESGSRKVLAQKPFDANMRPNEPRIAMLVLWNISLEKIAIFEDGNLAIKILCCMAYMSSTNIPQELLHFLFRNECSQDSFENAIEILEDFSLIASSSTAAPDAGADSLSIHRMIQDATIENLKITEAQTTTTTTTTHPIFNQNTFHKEGDVFSKLSIEAMNYLKNAASKPDPISKYLAENLLEMANQSTNKIHVKECRDLRAGAAGIESINDNLIKSMEVLEKDFKATPSLQFGNEILEKMQLKQILAAEPTPKSDDGGSILKLTEIMSQFQEGATRALGPGFEDTVTDIHDEMLRKGTAFLGELEGKLDEMMGSYRKIMGDLENIQGVQSVQLLMNDCAYFTMKMEELSKTVTDFVTEELDPNIGDLPSEGIQAIKSSLQDMVNSMSKSTESLKTLLLFKDSFPAGAGPGGPLNLGPAFQSKEQYAQLLIDQGKHELAALFLLEILKTEEFEHGSDHPSTLLTKSKLASLYIKTEELDKALPMLLDVEVFERVLGPEHPETWNTANNLASIMMKQDKFQEALALFKKVFKFRKQALRPNHPDTLTTMFNIGVSYYNMKDFDKAARVAQDVLPLRKVELGTDHPSTIKTLELLTDSRTSLDERNLSIMRFMELTDVDEEIGRSLLEASNWNIEVALDSFFNHAPKESIDILEKQNSTTTSTITRSPTNLDEDSQNDKVVSFMEMTHVNEEIGRSLLQASNWNLEVALDSFFNSSPNDD